MNEEYIKQVFDFISQYLFLTLVSAAILLIINAFFGYKIFKFVIVIESSIGLGFLGNALLGPLIFQNPPEGVNLSAILGIALAVVGALLAMFFFKLMLFINGAGLGFVLGAVGCYLLSSNEFFAKTWVIIAFGAISAIILGVLFIFFFKPVYIIVSSILGLTAAGFILSYLICPNIYVILSIIMMSIGFIAGIFAAVYQFRKNSRYYFY